MSGHYPAGVLAEVMNDDGSVLLPELEQFAEEHGLLIGTIATDLIAFHEEKLVEGVVRPASPPSTAPSPQSGIGRS